jgi:hypothetical protein
VSHITGWVGHSFSRSAPGAGSREHRTPCSGGPSDTCALLRMPTIQLQPPDPEVVGGGLSIPLWIHGDHEQEKRPEGRFDLVFSLQSQRGSNPCPHLERVVS